MFLLPGQHLLHRICYQQELIELTFIMRLKYLSWVVEWLWVIMMHIGTTGVTSLVQMFLLTAAPASGRE